MSNAPANHLIVRTLAAALLAACAAPQPGEGSSETRVPAPPSAAAPVGLSLDRSAYTPGSRVQLTIVNRTGDRFAFNPCTRVVEQWRAGVWVAAPVDSNRVCTMEAWLLDPRATRTATTDLPSRIDAGTYRLVLRLTRESDSPGAAISAESDAFRIE